MFPRMVQQPANRDIPQGPPQMYQTYSMRMPVRTHWQRVPCSDSNCNSHVNGWVTKVDVGTQLGRKQAYYITHDKSRSFTMSKAGDTVYEFTFAPGQQCFEEHFTRNMRPPHLLVRGGDWRGNPLGTARQHKYVEDWVEDQQEVLSQVRLALQRG